MPFTIHATLDQLFRSCLGTFERCIDSCPRLLGDDGVSLHLAEMTEGDVWNLAVDTGNPSNFAERYRKVESDVRGGEEEEDGAGIKTKRVEFVANGFMYSVQTTNRVKNKEDRWEGRAEVTLIGLLKSAKM